VTDVAHRDRLVAGYLLLTAVAVGQACAAGTPSSPPGSGGAASAQSAGGSGGTGGQELPCGVDCSTIKTGPCNVGKCNPVTKQCEIVSAPDGNACEDGKFCTKDDRCMAGVCTAGPPNDCGMKGEVCHTIECDETAKSCSNMIGSDGTKCTDPENLCTVGGKCQNGLCIGKINDCLFAPVPNDCHVATCNPKTGKCDPMPGNEGNACTDLNDLCTVSKTCSKGMCVGGKPKDCSFMTNGCNLGVCNKGECSAKVLKDNDLCDDLNACTVGETCSANKCSGGSAISQCKDGDKCCPASCDEKNDSDCGVRVGLGSNHGCVRQGDGAVYCWGHNFYGQLGNGSQTNAHSATLVSMLTNTAMVSGGQSHTCAVAKDGTAKCWGYNFYGQLGSGNKTTSHTPVAVNGLTGAVAIAAGSYHTCAVFQDKSVKCWGDNFYGQLGNGSNTSSSTPVSVSGISTAIAVSAGIYHSCAVLDDKTVKCWGYNTYGQLGNGTTTDSNTPVAVSSLSNAVDVALGGQHSCALSADSSVKCWGANTSGQLGNGTNNASTIPVAVSNISTATSLGSGEIHTCARLADGSIKCWGANTFGGLGDGTKNASNTPVEVTNIGFAAAVDAGAYHTCAVLQGSVRCWGYNYYGQLGNGNNNDSGVPVLVSGL
jgi:hypothetical protein